jgi:uncharacterized membrane protein YjjP (DUF1212 family)
MPQPRDRAILDFMLVYAKRYLASGGPTSRLEDCLLRIGAFYNRQAEIFATPTGVFVTLNDPTTEDDPKTALLRIRETGTDLGQLCKLERVFEDLLSGQISLFSANEMVRAPAISALAYRRSITALAAFFAGMASSFQTYQRWEAALVSGVITVIIWALMNFVLKRHVSNPIFSDFMAAFLTLTFAALAHALVAPLSVEAYAIGGIVLLVPGLALTTAISELAEQNLVSGTAKFMQATLALLALGLAYVLFQQLSFSLELRSVLQPVVAAQKFHWASAVAVLVNITCFGVIFRVPPRALIWSTLTGAIGVACFHALIGTRGAAAAPYIAAVMVGMVSLGFGRLSRLPSQVYSVPGVVAMLPGMLALNSFRYFATGDQDTGMSFVFQVAVTAVSIVFGLMSARIPFTIAGERYRKILARRRKTQA